MNLSQGNKPLLDLVKAAYKGDVMLPDFQRNFVWARADVEELIKSLLEKMFIGNFLIHNVDPLDPPFKPIAIEGAVQVNSNFRAKPNILVLDGQQRLSSIFYVLYEPDVYLKNTSKPYVFFIDLTALLKGDIDNSVVSYPKSGRYVRSLLGKGNDYAFDRLLEEKLLPLKFLANDFTEIWYENYKSHFSKEEDVIVRDYVKNITEYQVLTLDVPLNEKPEEIAALFERINRTGIKLSVFDLLVARLYKFINLRDSWEVSFDENELLRKYALEDKRDNTVPHYFIQALALSNGLSIKSRDVLKMSDSVLNNESWQRVISTAENDVLPRLLDIHEYGVANLSRWLPYSNIIVPFLALFLNDKRNIEKINKWYWAAVMTERYSSSTDAKITKDYKDVMEWTANDSVVPESVSDIRTSLFSNYSLRDRTYAGSSIYKGVFNFLFMNDARDFYVDDKIKFNRNDLDDHHIFPTKFLASKNVKQHVNSILNKTLIHGTTNKSISKKAPGEYIQEMIKKHGSEKNVKQLLSNHFISEGMYDLMKSVTYKTNDEEVGRIFSEFIDMREQLIKEQIKNLTFDSHN